MKVGESDYRKGAKQRLAEAGVLLRAGNSSGSVYLAGRAVEGMLRALIWRQDSGYASGKKTIGNRPRPAQAAAVGTKPGNFS